MFADLHNHNHSRSYLWLKPKERKYRRKEKYNPWTVVASNMQARKKGGMASAYGQSDLVKLMNGKVWLTFNALYPIEKGFFDSDAFNGRGNLGQRLIRFLSDKKLPLRDFLQMFIMRIPDRMIDYFQSPHYSYWEALNDELDFAISREGKRSKNRIIIPGFVRNVFESTERRRSKYPKLLDASGTYKIPTTKQKLKDALEEKDTIAMVLTIEGAHSFGTDRGTVEDWLAHVDFVKKQWAYPVFFVTFAHHFDNKLCGHAHSFPDISALILDQSKRLNGKFTSAGWRMIRKLLSLNAQNEEDPNEGYRILIDVKHMSADSRKQFYEKIIKPCLAKGLTIPVIASHNGHSGRKTLDELIANYGQEKDDSFEPTGKLNNWNINVCDEDVQIIYETKGLLGLSLDQRIMGVPKKQKKTGKQNTIVAVWNTIEASLKAIYDRTDLSEEAKFKVWDCITLGSDFEGFIDPINEFKTALEYVDLKRQLIDFIETKRTASGGTLYGLTDTQDTEQVVENICVGNARRFVVENYPDFGS